MLHKYLYAFHLVVIYHRELDSRLVSIFRKLHKFKLLCNGASRRWQVAKGREWTPSSHVVDSGLWKKENGVANYWGTKPRSSVTKERPRTKNSFGKKWTVGKFSSESREHNNGQTVAGQGAIVTPGVSKKLLEALTRENTKLRQALDHITNRGPGGVDLAVVSIENLVFVVNISLNICWWRGVSDAKNRELRICTITMTFLFIKRSYYKEKILLLFFMEKF